MAASDDRGPAILEAQWISFGIALLLLCARMLSRIYFVHRVALDDWAILFTMLIAAASTILTTLSVQQGLGKHIDTLNPQQQLRAITYSWVGQALSIFTFAFGKIAIVLFLRLRVVSIASNRWHKWFLYSVAVSLLVTNTVCVTLVFVQCRPVKKLFLSTSPGQCWNPQITTGFAQFTGVYSALTDMGLAIFAVWIVWRLQMSIQNKLRLCFLLTIGALAAICAVIKTYYLSEHNAASVADFTYGQTNVQVWTAIEQYFIIIGACIPCIQPVVVATLRRIGVAISSQGKENRYALTDVSGRPSQSFRHSQKTAISTIHGVRDMRNARELATGSDENIVPILQPGITKTVDMRVDFDGQKSRSNRSWGNNETEEEAITPRDVLRS